MELKITTYFKTKLLGKNSKAAKTSAAVQIKESVSTKKTTTTKEGEGSSSKKKVKSTTIVAVEQSAPVPSVEITDRNPSHCPWEILSMST